MRRPSSIQVNPIKLNPMSSDADVCPLCESDTPQFFHQDQRRLYQRCEICELIFVPQMYHLNSDAEKAVYDQHQNNAEDAGYRNFLARLAQPLLDRLPSPVRGLDFGSGPGPVLHLMLGEAGHRVANYDKFYADDKTLLTGKYDFIAATEVVEHLASPGKELETLWRCLGRGGLLALMTKRAQGIDAFASWHYKNDPTHITFFSEKTFLWLAKKWNAKCDFYGNDVVIFEKT